MYIHVNEYSKMVPCFFSNTQRRKRAVFYSTITYGCYFYLPRKFVFFLVSNIYPLVNILHLKCYTSSSCSQLQ